MVIIVALALVGLPLTACRSPDTSTAASPYPGRVVFAVAPLRNESGSSHADGLRMADQLARQFELIEGVSVMPVNRAIEAMSLLGLHEVRDPADAMKLRAALDADALVVGSITAYEPYDPPKLGLATDLYVDHRRQQGGAELTDLRRLVGSAVGDDRGGTDDPSRHRQPVTAVSAFFDAADPRIRDRLQAYARHRGQVEPDLADWHLYRMSIDLFSEFVSRQISRKLIHAETLRLTGNPPPVPSS